MRSGIRAGVGMLLAMAMGSAVATPPSEAQVRQLMDVLSVDRMFSQMNQNMTAAMQRRMPCVPAAYWQGFVDEGAARELTDQLVPVYQRHFDAADIDGLLAFYRSPLGQKVLTQMPQAMAEASKVGQQWGQQRAKSMLDSLQRLGAVDAKGRCPAGKGARPAAVVPASPTH